MNTNEIAITRLIEIGYRAEELDASDLFIAKQLGVSLKQVSRGRLMVHRLDPELLRRIEAGLLDFKIRRAEELSRCQPALRRKLTKRILTGDGVSESEIRDLRRKHAWQQGQIGAIDIRSATEVRNTLQKLCSDLLAAPEARRRQGKVAALLWITRCLPSPNSKLRDFWPLVEAFAEEFDYDQEEPGGCPE